MICGILSGLSIGMAILTLVMTSQRNSDLRDQFRLTQDEVEIYQIYVNKLHADLIAHGFQPPPIKGEE